MNFLDNLLLKMKFKIGSFVSDLKNGEEGISNIVATVILIVIVVVLAAALWAFLKGYFGDLFDIIFNKTPVPDEKDVPNPYGDGFIFF